MKILVTGSAGFIGFYLAKRLLERGDQVIGLDNLNSYYDVELKYARLRETGIERNRIIPGEAVPSVKYPAYRFYVLELENRIAVEKLFCTEKPDIVINLAAQAGVRYSLENPYTYVDSNVVGFVNLLECCRKTGIRHLIYASSSSVYGRNDKVPFSEVDRVDHPASLYAATKRAGELMAGVYSSLYRLPTTGLRFFTVYGPWGRPDMAPMLFAKAILSGNPIKVFNRGNLSRDFTYIDDIIANVLSVIDKGPDAQGPAAIYNIGCGHPVSLTDFINVLETALGKRAYKEMFPMQNGDVYRTYADMTRFKETFGSRSVTSLEEGIPKFVAWYMAHKDLVL